MKALLGNGAAYVRVSDDEQDVERQFEAARSFEKRMGATIPKAHWFKDEGWARDEADTRPEFQRMLKLAKAGQISWIVVDRLDRFGTKSAKQLMHFLYVLGECGCRLFDASGKDWTGEDDATEITALIEGKKSEKEQREKSHRVLGAKVVRARAGEWQGGPARLGLDVVCFHRETDKELWRVITEARDKRIKLYPSGKSERFDGKGNFPKWQEVTEVLRLAPSKDKGKVAAAVNVFKRFATESVSPSTLAHSLNDLGYRTAYGQKIQGGHVGAMLEDPIYIGYYAFNKRHFGKFNRYGDSQVLLDVNFDGKGKKNDKADWILSPRLFAPLVDQKTWDAVQKKLEEPKRAKAPTTSDLYLAGLVYCGNCGGRMVSSGKQKGGKNRKLGFMCGTYHKAAREKNLDGCECRRNGVLQETIEGYIEKYLEQAGVRLDLLTQGLDSSDLTRELERSAQDQWTGFADGIARLTAYLAKHHPEQYSAVSVELGEPEYVHPDDAVAAYADCFRANFDPATVTAEIETLGKEEDELIELWKSLPTARAKDKAKLRLEAVERRIEELHSVQADLADSVASSWRAMNNLQLAIADARDAMKASKGEHARRVRAQAIRAVVQRIECTFADTGNRGGGWGKKNATLTDVAIYPVAGESAVFPAESGGSKSTLPYSSAHSCMYRTCTGRTR